MSAVATAECAHPAPAPTLPREIELPTNHGFGPGFYARSIFIPAGTTLIGKTHATEHIFMLTKGDITLYSPDGTERRVVAPFQMVCPAGTQRAGFAHADTVCTNIHITTETDLDKLEAELITAPALEAPAAQEALP